MPRAGCPIRRSTDRGLLAAPRGLSQPAASFIGPTCQGIPRVPLAAWILLARDRKWKLSGCKGASRQWREGVAPRERRRIDRRLSGNTTGSCPTCRKLGFRPHLPVRPPCYARTPGRQPHLDPKVLTVLSDSGGRSGFRRGEIPGHGGLDVRDLGTHSPPYG